MLAPPAAAGEAAANEEHPQADVAENQPGEGDDEAPDAHTDQQQRVHRLNKTR